jgi:hypothetical protein
MTVFTVSGSFHPKLLPAGVLDELKLQMYLQFQLIQDTSRQLFE